MDSLVTNKLKIKVNKARQHRTQIYRRHIPLTVNSVHRLNIKRLNTYKKYQMLNTWSERKTKKEERILGKK